MIPNPPQGAWASRPHVVLLFFLFLLCLSNPAAAQTAAPTLIPFQARLTNQLGEAYGSGQYTLTFNLYDQAVGGATVWTERHEKVGLINGMVNVFLGSISTFPQWQPGSNPQVALFNGTKYLGITVDADGNPATADPEMVPRTIIVNAFHAQNASNLAGYNWSAILQSGSNNPQTGFIRADKLNPAGITNAQIAPLTINTASVADGAITSEKLAGVVREAIVPPGTILSFGGTVAPAGFLLCDGTAYNRAGTYSTLFAAISTNFGAPNGTTFNVPDLRGQFLRGLDGNGGRDPDKVTRTAMAFGGNTGNNIGSIQSDGFKSHTHIQDPHSHPISSGTYVGTYSSTATPFNDGNSPINRNSTQSTTATNQSTGGNETRPTNTYVNYIIKY